MRAVGGGADKRSQAPNGTVVRQAAAARATADPPSNTLAERRRRFFVRRRGWVLRRALAFADALGLLAAFAVTEKVFGVSETPWDDRLGVEREIVVFCLSLPLWIVVAHLHGLYGQDEERTDHSTADEFIAVFHVVTVGVWLALGGAWLTKLAQPEFPKLLTFWALAIAFITVARVVARHACRRRASFIQNTVIVGAGEVGRLVARKLRHHPEYGLNLLGFVDGWNGADAGGDVPVLGGPEALATMVRSLEVERVIVTPAGEPDEEALEIIHTLKTLDVQIDIVPRMFEVVGPGIVIHSIEGVPVIGLPPTRLPRVSMAIKRAIDVIVALVGLVLTAPLFAYIAWRIRRDSPGPIFFRQTRVGMGMRDITMLKFRTMRTDTDDTQHREYIRAIMDRAAVAEDTGLFKLERHGEITPFGRWLRRTSLDELPQLINVLRGDMSLVGPRPCLRYEMEHFKPHHFERFNVPAGLTGLWQVTARGRSTFVEALDMDVAYARGWSIGLDLWLLARTPLKLVGLSGTS